MRIWCARLQRAHQIRIPRNRRERVMEALAGRIGVCAVCGYPVSAICVATDRAQRIMPAPSLAGPRRSVARGMS